LLKKDNFFGRLVAIPLKFAFIGLVAIMSSCATHDLPVDYSSSKGARPPSLANGFVGGIWVEPMASESDYIRMMMNRCKDYGGLDRNSLRSIYESMLGERVIQYKCNFANHQ
jgi:hypothetical protein